MSVDLLYPNEEAKSKKLTNTAFYNDLGFDHALFFGTLRLFGSINETNKVLDYLTYDIPTIKYRQDVFDDLMTCKDFRTSLEKLMPRLIELIDLKNQRVKEGDTAAHLYSICEMDLYFETLISLNETLQDAKNQYKSEGIKNLAEFINKTVNDEEFKTMRERMSEASQTVKGIKSVTLGVNLDAQLRPKEAGILSVNNEVFKAGNVMDKILRVDFKNDGFYCTTPLDGITKGMTPEEADNFFMSLDASLDAVFSSLIKKWSPMVKDYISKNTDFLANIVDQLSFYIAGVAMMEKLRIFRMHICKPEIKPIEEKQCHITGLYNPLHILKEGARDYAVNSIVFDQFGGLYILTGPSRSGKTLFSNALGVAQIFFQLGFYVPADNAVMSPVKNLLVHSPKITAAEKNRTKVIEECEKLGEIVKDLEEYTMIIIDQSLECANPGESSYILSQIILNSAKAKALGIISTDLSELGEQTDEFNAQIKDGSKVDTLVMKTENDRPVFIVERQRPESAQFAREISDKYGLTAKL